MRHKQGRQTGSGSGTGIVKIGDIVPQLIARYGLHQRRNAEEIEEAWKEIAGEEYAAMTKITGLFRGTLTIAVPHNAFVQELSFRQNEFVGFLASRIRTEKITKIRFVVQ
ncbi:MAG: DUF721 domain-containing protein [Planctomycetaceae bacterium]|jgi:predicted nucleic acid-binding Zn ribbon protein|nr:DUF721 domain-containing protein [Planctomycetaceae bacterium]